jgi:toxin ParE1/3/4
MEFQVIWSPEALDDLHSLTSFIAQDNPRAAESVGLALINGTELLSKHPLLGRLVPELNNTSIRELIRPPYRVIYEVSKRRRLVEVLRIWHGARGTPEIS